VERSRWGKGLHFLGLAGRWGYRLSTNLKGSEFEVRHVERSPAGLEHVKTGLD
jgi:D-apionate oxidoisomerase